MDKNTRANETTIKSLNDLFLPVDNNGEDVTYLKKEI